MSSASLRGLLCLAVAVAMLVGVGIWVYQQSHLPAVSAPLSNPGTSPNRTRVVTFDAPAPKKAVPVQVPQPVAPAVDEPAPFIEQPRFFQKGFKGGGFAKKSRINLSDRLGVRLQKPSDDTIQQLGIADTDGLVVEDVRIGSAAESVGIKVGDILLSFDGQNVPNDVDQFHFQLETLKTNQPIDVMLLRDGKSETLQGLILPESSPRFFAPRRQLDN
jgi:hypothetical protein